MLRGIESTRLVEHTIILMHFLLTNYSHSTATSGDLTRK